MHIKKSLYAILRNNIVQVSDLKRKAISKQIRKSPFDHPSILYFLRIEGVSPDRYLVLRGACEVCILDMRLKRIAPVFICEQKVVYFPKQQVEVVRDGAELSILAVEFGYLN